ncbi:MAG: NYN domain-containing protein, partial [Verrucomicrobiota bacterium]
HVDTFVVISGDSDFSPLVSKLRENNKTVIGVGVKNSTSDLLIANCDEFIYYDDLVRGTQRKRSPAKKKVTSRKKSSHGKEAANSESDLKQEAWDLVVKTYEALLPERAEDEKVWGSMIKQAIKRRKPGFAESYYGYQSFGELLEDAAKAGVISVQRDGKSGGYVVTSA